MDIVGELRKMADQPDCAYGEVMLRAADEIERLRSLAGPVAASPTASEIYYGLRHLSPAADAEGN